MNKLIINILFFSLFSLNLFANDCKEILNQYDNINSSEWSLRLDDKIEKFGCGVIPIYSFLEKNNFTYIMDAIDDNPNILVELEKLFSNRIVLNLLFSNKTYKKLIIENSQNLKRLHNINYLFSKKLNYGVIKEIKENPILLNAFIFASANSDNYRELKSNYFHLKTLGINELKLFSLIYSSIGDKYSFEDLLENFITLKKRLTKIELKQVTQYTQFPYFLYPSREDLNYKGANLREKQKEFQSLIITIYQSAYKNYLNDDNYENDNKFALRVVEKIYPYLLQNKNFKEIEKIIPEIFKDKFMNDLSQGSICSKEFQEKFKKFGGGNLDNLVSLKKERPDLYKSLINSDSSYKNLNSLLYIANVNKNFEYDKKQIFFRLLNNLTADKFVNSVILYKLQNIGYFNKIITIPDYKTFVKANENDASFASQKFEFILKTDYPNRDRESVLSYLSTNQIDKAEEKLNKLYDVKAEEMQETKSEKYERLYDIADNTITAASIALIPFTGGASVGIIIAKKAAMKGAKIAVKKYAKSIVKKTTKYSITKGIKNFTRNGINKIKHVKNRIASSKKFQKFGKVVDKVDSVNTKFAIGVVAGTTLFAIIPHLQQKQICQGE